MMFWAWCFEENLFFSRDNLTRNHTVLRTRFWSKRDVFSYILEEKCDVLKVVFLRKMLFSVWYFAKILMSLAKYCRRKRDHIAKPTPVFPTAQSNCKTITFFSHHGRIQNITCFFPQGIICIQNIISLFILIVLQKTQKRDVLNYARLLVSKWKRDVFNHLSVQFQKRKKTYTYSTPLSVPNLKCQI